jgi:hypothetical protein
MIQKFKRYTFVEVKRKVAICLGEVVELVPPFLGIIDCSYSEKYGGSNITDYSVYQYKILPDKSKEIVNCISWYSEDFLLEAPYQNREEAEDIIEKYNLKLS